MSYKFSKRSLNNLKECHPKLQKIAHEAIKYIDFAVIDGHRSKEEQNLAYENGFSTVKWPMSRHNTTPSLAFDFVPWHKEKPHVRWGDLNSFIEVITVMKREAKKLGIVMISGGDWVSFKDYPHIQLRRMELDNAQEKTKREA